MSNVILCVVYVFMCFGLFRCKAPRCSPFFHAGFLEETEKQDTTDLNLYYLNNVLYFDFLLLQPVIG